MSTHIELKKILPSDIRAKWDSLILSQTIRDNLERSIVWPVTNLDGPRDHGFILFGPPGTGKTTIPYAIAKKLNWTVYYISPKDFVSENNGIEYSIKRIFETIQTKYAPIKKEVDAAKKKNKKKKGNAKIVFVFDEIDELVTSRGSESDRQSRLMTTMMLPLFNELREDAENCGFIFFALTNHISKFDPAIIRQGRFDLILPVGLPNRIMRYHFFEKMVSKLKDDYYENFDVKINDWYRNMSGKLTHSVDYNAISTISQRLSFGDIETICKRVVEEILAKEEHAFRDFLNTKKKQAVLPYTINLDTSKFLPWINKYLVSNNRSNNDMDRHYQDVSIYTRGSSPNTELNRIQPRILQEFESLHIFCSLNSSDHKWKIRKDNEIFYELTNLNEINTFTGTLNVTLTGPGISQQIQPQQIRLQPGVTDSNTIHVTPTSSGKLKIVFKINGTIIVQELDSLDNKKADLLGSITQIKIMEIE